MQKLITFILLIGLSSIGWAEASFDEGIEYQIINKIQPAPTDGSVEVIEFFSYGCPHCYRFEPYIQQWKKTKPDNVKFIHVPAVFNKNWEKLANYYYAAEVLGILDTMHPQIFEALHGQNKVRSAEELKHVFAANGVSNEKLEATLNSFAVNAKTRKAIKMTKDYGIESVPVMIVQGKYLTNGTLAQGHQNVFKVVDFLIEKVQAGSQ